MSHTEKVGFQFRQFFVGQQHCAMKVGTDGVLLGAWAPLRALVLESGCYPPNYSWCKDTQNRQQKSCNGGGILSYWQFLQAKIAVL